MRASIVGSLLLLALTTPTLGATPEEKCEISKNLLAGRYAACRQAAEATALKKGIPVDFAKCDAQFEKSWTNAESKTAKQGTVCPDGGAESEVSDVVAESSATVAAILSGNPPAPDPVCGNGSVEAGEQCDTSDLGGATCGSELPSLGCVEGAPACTDSCTLDLSACSVNLDCMSVCVDPHPEFTAAERNVSAPANADYCDQGGASPEWVGAGWYRFSGAAGERMPEAPPAEFSCNTDAPGWLNGSHPSVAEGVAQREVCFNFFGNPCEWTADIAVLNCGDFYLYNLPQVPVCSLRYCGESPPL